MKKTKFFVAFINIAFLLSACQNTPETIDRNGKTIASKSDDFIASETTSISTFEITETNLQADSKEVNLNSVVKSYSSGEITININANVEENNTDLYKYEYQKHIIENDELIKMLEALFGKNFDQIKYDRDNDIYILNINNDEFVAENLNTNRISISGRKLDLCPYEANKYDYNTELGFSSQNAINQCNEFLNLAKLNGYNFSNIESYGKTQGEQYYKITYKYSLDSKNVTTEYSNSDIIFKCIDSGIYSISGNLYDYDIYENDPVIISYENAVDNLCKYAENITLYCNIDRHSDFINVSDENGRITLINIKDICLEYVYNYDNILVPSWRFYLSSNGVEVDNNFILAVDAINGDVIAR